MKHMTAYSVVRLAGHSRPVMNCTSVVEVRVYAIKYTSCMIPKASAGTMFSTMSRPGIMDPVGRYVERLYTILDTIT